MSRQQIGLGSNPQRFAINEQSVEIEYRRSERPGKARHGTGFAPPPLLSSLIGPRTASRVVGASTP